MRSPVPGRWNPLLPDRAFMGVPVVMAILLFAFNLIRTIKALRLAPRQVLASPGSDVRLHFPVR